MIRRAMILAVDWFALELGKAIPFVMVPGAFWRLAAHTASTPVLVAVTRIRAVQLAPAACSLALAFAGKVNATERHSRRSVAFFFLRIYTYKWLLAIFVMRNTMLIGIFLILLSATPPFDALAQEKGGFLASAPPKWNAYQAAFDTPINMRLYNKVVDLKNNGATIAENVDECKIGSNGILVSTVHTAPSLPGMALVNNRNYSAELKQKHGENLWIVSELNVSNKSNPGSRLTRQKLVPVFETKKLPKFGPFSIANVWLPDLIQKPGFRVLSERECEIDGRRLVKVDFSFQQEVEKKTRELIPSKGWLIVDPKNYWCVVESEVAITYPTGEQTLVHNKVECTDSDGVPVLKSITAIETGTLNKKQMSVLNTATYNIQKKDSGASEFTLSAFGLLEPVTETPSPPNRNFLWITLGAVAAFIVGLLVRRKVKSLEAKAS